VPELSSSFAAAQAPAVLPVPDISQCLCQAQHQVCSVSAVIPVASALEDRRRLLFFLYALNMSLFKTEMF